jgi:hypothetical protein
MNNVLFAWPRADGGNKTGIGQFHETPSGFLDCVAITSVEATPDIAGVIHHDMNCHYLSLYRRSLGRKRMRLASAGKIQSSPRRISQVPRR